MTNKKAIEGSADKTKDQTQVELTAKQFVKRLEALRSAQAAKTQGQEIIHLFYML